MFGEVWVSSLLSVPRPDYERDWLVCSKSCIPGVSKENSLCMFSEVPGGGSQRTEVS